MTISNKTKKQLHNLIYERAYEIEKMLEDDNFFLAKMAGLKPEQISEASLQVALNELKKTFSQ